MRKIFVLTILVCLAMITFASMAGAERFVRNGKYFYRVESRDSKWGPGGIANGLGVSIAELRAKNPQLLLRSVHLVKAGEILEYDPPKTIAEEIGKTRVVIQVLADELKKNEKAEILTGLKSEVENLKKRPLPENLRPEHQATRTLIEEKSEASKRNQQILLAIVIIGACLIFIFVFRSLHNLKQVEKSVASISVEALSKVAKRAVPDININFVNGTFPLHKPGDRMKAMNIEWQGRDAETLTSTDWEELYKLACHYRSCQHSYRWDDYGRITCFCNDISDFKNFFRHLRRCRNSPFYGAENFKSILEIIEKRTGKKVESANWEEVEA